MALSTMIRRILVVDDHPICVEALKAAVFSLDSTIQVDAAESIAETEDMLREHEFVLVLLDLVLRDGEGLANFSAVRAVAPSTPVLIVSGTNSAETVRRSYKLGAKGYLNKRAPFEEMRAAISAVLDGGVYYPQADDLEEMEGESISLSPAQARVMSELAKGNSNKIMAYNLGLSEATIKSHLSAIYRVLGVTNRAQAILAVGETSTDDGTS